MSIFYLNQNVSTTYVVLCLCHIQPLLAAALYLWTIQTHFSSSLKDIISRQLKVVFSITKTSMKLWDMFPPPCSIWRNRGCNLPCLWLGRHQSRSTSQSQLQDKLTRMRPDQQFKFLLTSNSYFCWPTVYIPVDQQFIFLLTSNSYCCCPEQFIFLLTSRLFLSTLPPHPCNAQEISGLAHFDLRLHDF